MVNRKLPRGAADGSRSSGKTGEDARREYVRKDDHSGGGPHAGGVPAKAACGAAIAEFEAIITSDMNTGNVAKRVHARVVTELAKVKAACTAGRDAEATHALAAVKSRHGYR